MDECIAVTRTNECQSHQVDVPDRPLKVATRVRIPLGLFLEFQFRGAKCQAALSGSDGTAVGDVLSEVTVQTRFMLYTVAPVAG